jgi:hypothetical protein
MNVHYLEECVQEMEAFLDACYAGEPTSGTLIVDGTAFSPSLRALPGAAEVWEFGNDEDWELFANRADDKTEQVGFAWEEGMLRA